MPRSGSHDVRAVPAAAVAARLARGKRRGGEHGQPTGRVAVDRIAAIDGLAMTSQDLVPVGVIEPESVRMRRLEMVGAQHDDTLGRAVQKKSRLRCIQRDGDG